MTHTPSLPPSLPPLRSSQDADSWKSSDSASAADGFAQAIERPQGSQGRRRSEQRDSDREPQPEPERSGPIWDVAADAASSESEAERHVGSSAKISSSDNHAVVPKSETETIVVPKRETEKRPATDVGATKARTRGADACPRATPSLFASR